MERDNEERKEQPEQKDDREWASLTNFLTQLYVMGGLPLVLIGVAAGNLFLPYGDAQQWVVSITLSVLGAMLWAASGSLALFRWKMEADSHAKHIDTLAKQDTLILETACEIAKKEDSAAVKQKVEDLIKALKDSGVRALGTIDLTENTGGEQQSKPVRDA